MEAQASLYSERGGLDALCDMGQINFPFDGIFFTQTRRELNQLGASQITIHEPLGVEVSTENVDRTTPRPMKSESLGTGPDPMVS